MAGAEIKFRPSTDEMRDKIIARAAEQDISVNEWLNRVALFGLTKGGKLKVTTTVEMKI